MRPNLFFVVAASVVPAVLVAGALIGYDYYDRERSRLVRDSIGTARALAAAVDTDLTGAKSALFALATSPYLASGDLAGFHRQALAALKDQSFVNVVLVDPAGRQLLNTLRRFGEPLPARGGPDQLQRIFETGEPVITDLFVGPVARKHLIAVGIPVRRGGAIRYALNAGLTPESLSALLGRQRLPPGWTGAIFDGSGTIVARTHEAARFVGQKGSAELVQRMKEVGEDAIESRTLEDISVLTVFSRSPVSGWTVAIGIPTRELLTHLWSSMARLFLVIFIMLGTALGLAILLGRRALR